MVADEFKRGLIFTGAYAGSVALVAVGLNKFDLKQKEINGGDAFIFAGVAGAVFTMAWSIGDAVRVAKINNLAYRDQTTFLNKIELKPYFTTNNNDHYLGASFQIKF